MQSFHHRRTNQDTPGTMSGQPPSTKPTRRAMTPGELLATRQGPAGGERTTGASGTAATAETGQQALLEQFQGLLQQEGTLASDDRDELVRVFENALQDAAASNGQAASNAFDTATWHETVDMLRRHAATLQPAEPAANEGGTA